MKADTSSSYIDHEPIVSKPKESKDATNKQKNKFKQNPESDSASFEIDYEPQKNKLKRIPESDTDYQPNVSKPTKYKDVSNTQKKKLKTKQESDTDSSHTDYKQIVSKHTQMEYESNKNKKTMEGNLEAYTDTSKPDYKPIVSKSKEESNTQKNKLKKEPKANTESLSNRKPNRKSLQFQSV
jgi:hypothetical protein